MGLFRLAADKAAYIFGVRITKRLRDKLYSVLEKLDQGHHVPRIYCKNLVGRMRHARSVYEKFSTLLRVKVCVNRMKELGLNKGLENRERLRQKLVAITDRFAGFEAQSLNVHVDFPLFQRMALPVWPERPNRRYQDPRHPDDAADGGATQRRHATQRLAVRRHPSSDPHHVRLIRRHLHPHPTPL
jgi:hypothetical protein